MGSKTTRHCDLCGLEIKGEKFYGIREFFSIPPDIEKEKIASLREQIDVCKECIKTETLDSLFKKKAK